MDYLINKSDGSIVEEFPGGATKVKLPGMTGSDAAHVGDKRPIELGAVDEVLDEDGNVIVPAEPAPYLLIMATINTPDLWPDEKRGADIVTVDVGAQTVVVDKPAVDMTQQEIWDRDIAATQIDMPDWLEDHIEDAHSGVAGPKQQAAYNNKKTVRGRKP